MTPIPSLPLFSSTTNHQTMTPDYEKDLLDENLVQTTLKKILSPDHLEEMAPPPESNAQEPHALSSDVKKVATFNCPLSIPDAIHEFVEWSIPGETPALIAKRASMHYNCAVNIANTSLVVTITSLALTILGAGNFFIGFALAYIATLVHRKTTLHLQAINRNLDAFILSQYKKLAPNDRNSAVISQNLAKKIQPTHFCCFSWYHYMPTTKAEFERHIYTQCVSFPRLGHRKLEQIF